MSEITQDYSATVEETEKGRLINKRYLATCNLIVNSSDQVFVLLATYSICDWTFTEVWRR